MHTLTCERCGNAYSARRADSRYCSGRCRLAAHRAKLTVTDTAEPVVTDKPTVTDNRHRVTAIGPAVTDTVIEPGYWHTGEPPEAPPSPDDGPSAAYWGWPPLPAVTGNGRHK